MKEKLDKEFSEFIRLRDSDSNGYCKCISCGKVQYWKEVDCGHFINRKHMSLRFNQKNCNSQCRKCNRFDEGNNEGYRRGLISKYGNNVIDELFSLKNEVFKITNVEYSIGIAHYKKEIEKLKKTKTL